MKVKDIREMASNALDRYSSDIYYHYSQLTEDAYMDGYIDGALEIMQHFRGCIINEACNWLIEHIDDYDDGEMSTATLVEDFWNTMMKKAKNSKNHI